MSEPFIGEIRLFAGNFAPAGWALCSGQLLPISENEVLFQLIGTTYGGDGETTFNLPDLRGRVPIHQGQGSGLSSYQMGQIGGVETVTLAQTQMPVHSHPMVASTNAGVANSPEGRVLATPPEQARFTADTAGSALASQMVGSVGGSQPHENLQPYLCITYIISLFGIYPSPT